MTTEHLEDLGIGALRAMPLFNGVPGREILTVAKLGTWETVAEGTTITNQHQRHDHFFIIAEGTADVLFGPDDRLKLCTQLTVGDHFGEMALVFNSPCFATIRAATPMKLLVLQPAVFYELLTRMPALRDRISHAGFERLEMQRQILAAS